MPLAHILAPQLAKKTAEIEAALAPASVGYLASQGVAQTTDDSLFRQNVSAARDALPVDAGRAFSQGYYNGSVGEHERQVQEKARREIEQFQRERGAAPAPTASPAIGYLRVAAPPTASEQALQTLRSQRPTSPFQVFKNAAVRSAMQADKTQKGTQLLPNAPTPAPIAAAPQKGGVIPLPKGAVGIDETGQAVDKKGKKLGYLAQPAMVTPYGDVSMRTADRRPNDILITKDGGLSDDDAFGTYHLQQMYGKHLNETRENRGPDGMPTDKFPEGYFKGMTKKQRENIIHGVEALRALEAGTRT